METDLKQVRRDLKAWQVAFHAEHQRAPTRSDIDAAPEIGRRARRATLGAVFARRSQDAN